MKTKCPHLEEGKKMHMCNASSAMMIPSIYEMASFCAKEEHCRCPVFMKHADRKHKMKGAEMIDAWA